ncbi:hypothetical protein Cgig2_031084 [Carnegiea gigantea]|uniref:Uncharacterized protein n=1 Tax=Carnegiea gigantea TaxID=171969 RepID=A0A9Q1QFW9_9CARY|nr:hypothetical protein Cgig2_031084 [Carnegiea gigantea]
MVVAATPGGGDMTKASIRAWHSSGTRRNSYNYDRSDHADREGNWNTVKARAAARNQNHNQVEKSRVDRPAANENQAGRPWVRHEPLSSHQSQKNGPVQPSSSRGSSATMSYGMYPFPGMKSSGIMSNGPTVPSVVMLYPYDHNSGNVSPGELEFGSLGPVGLVGMNDASQPADGTRVRGPFVGQRHHGRSTQHSSPDQPSSPYVQRQEELIILPDHWPQGTAVPPSRALNVADYRSSSSPLSSPSCQFGLFFHDRWAREDQPR